MSSPAIHFGPLAAAPCSILGIEHGANDPGSKTGPDIVPPRSDLHRDNLPAKGHKSPVLCCIWRRVHLGVLGLWLTGCTGPSNTPENDDQIIAWVNDTPIDRRVVQQIAKERSVDQARALELAADTLRLYFAYQEEVRAAGEDQDLIAFLKTQGAVRVWLRDRFEPETAATKIPNKRVNAALEKVASQPRPFGPKLHGLCQVIVVPASAEPDTDARQIPGFEASARQVIADMDKNLNLALPDLKNSERCELFDQLTELIAAKRPPELKLKREALRLDLSSTQWDQDFVAQIAPQNSPTMLPPFMTKFGLHLVYLAKIFPANHPETKAQREQQIRALMEPQWRSDQMEALLEKLRKSELIEWAKPTNEKATP